MPHNPSTHFRRGKYPRCAQALHARNFACGLHRREVCPDKLEPGRSSRNSVNRAAGIGDIVRCCRLAEAWFLAQLSSRGSIDGLERATPYHERKRSAASWSPDPRQIRGPESLVRRGHRFPLSVVGSSDLIQYVNVLNYEHA